MQRMIDDSITCGIYTPTTDNTLKDFKTFRDFVYRIFKDYAKYDKNVTNLKRAFTAKMHNFVSQNIITTEQLKFPPVFAQLGSKLKYLKLVFYLLLQFVSFYFFYTLDNKIVLFYKYIKIATFCIWYYINNESSIGISPIILNNSSLFVF